MGAEFLLIVLAIAVMILFIPVAIAVGIKIIATDWYLQNRRSLFVGLAVLEIILLLLIFVTFFGVAI